MPSPRHHALEFWNAAVDAVRAEPLVRRAVSVNNNVLSISGTSWPIDPGGRIVVVGGGKAGSGMTVGLISAIDGQATTEGWINVPEGTLPTPEKGNSVGGIRLHEGRPAGVNEPTAAGVFGTEKILELARSCCEEDICIALISGGGSALMPAPALGITLEQKREVTQFLSSAGANIHELNTVRKHLSRIKGGGLLEACNAGTLITIVLSDVLGDPLDLIASGPTIPDPSSNADALAVLERFDPTKQLPASVYETVANSKPIKQSETATARTFVLGNNRVAVDAAAKLACQANYSTHATSASECEGSAEEIGRSIADELVRALRSESDSDSTCWVSGGEPTVQLAHAEIRGKGGRNQQLVLAAYQRLLEHGLSDSEWEHLVVLSGGTDGEDGPTDAAGAFLDEKVHRLAQEKKLNPGDFLKRNDAYHFFKETGGLIITGPTGTNVCDVRIAICQTD